MEIRRAEKHPVKYAVNLTYEQSLRLQEYCEREDRSVASAIRHAIRLMLEKEG